MSAESGIKTFRDQGGLWENYDVMEVASIQGWIKNPALVLNFYNMRRKELLSAQPNVGHIGLAELEKDFKVQIITQNIDNLHERAGSTSVLHLHGELMKARSTKNPSLVYTLDQDHWEIKMGDTCKLGSQLRPHIVWFGEEVPNMVEAVPMVESADIFCVIGTSLNVYPAAGLLQYAPSTAPVFLIDPNPPTALPKSVHVIAKGAGEGVKKLKEMLAEYR